MRAILAVAEYGEDPFRLVCMMTLTEIGNRHISFPRVSIEILYIKWFLSLIVSACRH